MSGNVVVSQLGSPLVGSSEALASALSSLQNYSGSATFEAGTAKSSEIDTIKQYTSGQLNGAAITGLSGTASAILSAVAKLNTPPLDSNTLTVTITGDTDASDILALDDLSYVDTIVTSSVDNIDGTAADVKEALDILGDGAPEHFSSELSGAASAADIATIHASNGDGTIDGSSISSFTGTASALNNFSRLFRRYAV